MTQSNPIRRRDFLATTAAAIAAPTVIPSSALGKDGRPAPSERLTMGCIGVGGQGTGNMWGFLHQADCQVVAVCDVEEDRSTYMGGAARGRGPAKRMVEDYYAKNEPDGRYAGCDTYNDFRDLLLRDDIDTLTICTPDHWHALIAVAAARAGKDMYCEKPLANSVLEGRMVVDEVKRYGRILQVGSHERSRSNARYAAELVRNGRLGKLHTIEINLPIDSHKPIDPQPVMEVPETLDYNFWLGPAPEAYYTQKRVHFWFRYILDYSGGEMTDRGAHIIDLAQLGNNTDDTGPVEISAEGWAPPDGLFNTFMDYTFECKFANGVRMTGKCEGPRGLKFIGDKGWVFIHIHGGNLDAEPASLLKEIIGPNEEHLGRSPGHHRDFLNSVRNRLQPMAPAEVGHRSGSICHLLNIALRTKKKLQWDPVAERITNHPELNDMLLASMRFPWRISGLDV